MLACHVYGPFDDRDCGKCAPKLVDLSRVKSMIVDHAKGEEPYPVYQSPVPSFNEERELVEKSTQNAVPKDSRVWGVDNLAEA